MGDVLFNIGEFTERVVSNPCIWTSGDIVCIVCVSIRNYLNNSFSGLQNMSSFVISQILIGMAICSDIISFQFKKRVHIVSCLLVSCVLISLHFMCLGHWTAACLGLVAAGRFITSLLSTSKIFMGMFLGITIIVSALTYEGVLSILGCTGALFGTVASFSKEDKLLRQLMFIGTSLWLVHNVIAGSPGAILMEIIFLGSNAVGYFRYYIRQEKQILH